MSNYGFPNHKKNNIYIHSNIHTDIHRDIYIYSNVHTDIHISPYIYTSPHIYIAPEVLKGLKYTETADSWTLGCLLYYMLVGRVDTINNLPKHIT